MKVKKISPMIWNLNKFSKIFDFLYLNKNLVSLLAFPPLILLTVLFNKFKDVNNKVFKILVNI